MVFKNISTRGLYPSNMPPFKLISRPAPFTFYPLHFLAKGLVETRVKTASEDRRQRETGVIRPDIEGRRDGGGETKSQEMWLL